MSLGQLGLSWSRSSLTRLHSKPQGRFTYTLCCFIFFFNEENGSSILVSETEFYILYVWYLSVPLTVMKVQQCISLSILWCTYLVDLDAGRDWGQEEKGTTEDEMAGWHHQLDGREFEWTPGVGDGQGGLASCSWGRKESDTAELLNWTEIYIYIYTLNL